METQFAWRLGRRFGREHGLWVADSLEEAVRVVPAICRAVGYRQRDVHIWRSGSFPQFWVSRPNGQGGIGADNLAEAERIRRRVGPMLGVLVIREHGRFKALTRAEASRIAS